MTKRKKSRKSSKKQTGTRKRTRKNLGIKRSDLLPVLGLLVLTGAIFAKTVGFDFVNWDDDFNITKNPNLVYLDWQNIKGIFTSHVIGNYNPLTTLSFLLETHLVSPEPWIYHLDNVLLHLVCVYFAFRISRLLGLEMLPSMLVATLFALHPMRVESVAWITERKDVLFGAFYLAALVAYIKYIRSGFKRKYFLYALLLFVPSLLAKIQAVALPLSFLAVDYLLARPLKFKLLVEKIPFFALSVATGLIGIYFLKDQGSLGASEAVFGFIDRLFIGAYSYLVYIAKWIFPYRMSPLYPYPGLLGWYHYAAPVPVFAILGWMFYAYRKQYRWLVFGFLFFSFNIVFLLQIVGAGQGYLADRFTYIPYLGLMLTGGYYWKVLIEKLPKYKKAILGITAAYLLFLSFLTWRQIDVWKNSETLWNHVTKYYTKSALPYRNRATYYRSEGRYEEALRDYEKSLAFHKNADVFNSRARLYFDMQNWDKAIEDYNEALERKPNEAEFWINRGAAYAMKGDLERSLNDLNKGLEYEPNHLNGLKNRSLIFLNLNRYEEAHKDVLTYLENNPYSADMWYESGRLYRIRGNYQAAIEAFNTAIRLNAGNGLYYYERSKAFLSLNQKTQARADLRQAQSLGIKVKPEDLRRYD